MLVGPGDFVRRLKVLGFRDLNEGDYYGLSMALGSVDVTLYELLNAYRTLANGGRYNNLKMQVVQKRTAARQVMNRESAFIIVDILSDRTARSLTFGYENPLSTRFWTAVKTGTSKDMRDNWCVGFSDKYTVGVWVGNFSGTPMWNVSGTSGAAPVWLEVMNYLHQRKASTPPVPPAGIVPQRVEFNHSLEPSRNEWFVKGTEPLVVLADVIPSKTTSANAQEKLSIAYPLRNTIIALDPDIPDENSLVLFEVLGKGQFDLVLNNEKIGTGSPLVSWKPRYGRYVLTLVDKQGQTIDSVNFEVRGMPSLPADKSDDDDGDQQ
jgi:penicillin-binding protein 1C